MSASSKFFSNTSEKVTGRLQHLMKKHPIASNSVLCLNLWIAGDFVAQYSEFRFFKEEEEKQEKQLVAPSFREELDVSRTAKCAGFGATVIGPILATWYPYLEKVCVRHNITARFGLWGAPILKVVADEFIMDPPLISLFFGYMNVVEGGSWESFEQKMKTQFMPSWLASLAVWPFVLLGTFRYLPIYAQAPLINACCIVWDAYLSHRNTLSNYREQKKQEQIGAEGGGKAESGDGKSGTSSSYREQQEGKLGIS